MTKSIFIFIGLFLATSFWSFAQEFPSDLNSAEAMGYGQTVKKTFFEDSRALQLVDFARRLFSLADEMSQDPDHLKNFKLRAQQFRADLKIYYLVNGLNWNVDGIEGQQDSAPETLDEGARWADLMTSRIATAFGGLSFAVVRPSLQKLLYTEMFRFKSDAGVKSALRAATLSKTETGPLDLRFSRRFVRLGIILEKCLNPFFKILKDGAFNLPALTFISSEAISPSSQVRVAWDAIQKTPDQNPVSPSYFARAFLRDPRLAKNWKEYLCSWHLSD